VVRYLKWKIPDAQIWKELDEFLLARAMEHDSPSLLFRLACEHLASSMIVRPGPVALLKRVATAREAAKRETYDRYKRLLTPRRVADLPVRSGIFLTLYLLRWLMSWGPTTSVVASHSAAAFFESRAAEEGLRTAG
jgi:hypothetical protein